MNTPPKPDLLYGAEAIAEYLGLGIRQAYHLFERGDSPMFKIGRRVCARRSALDAWLAKREQVEGAAELRRVAEAMLAHADALEAEGRAEQ